MSPEGSVIYSSDFNEMSMLDDNELVKIFCGERETQRGRSAFSILLSRYLCLVRKRAYFYSSEFAESDDLVQEGFLAFVNAVNSFDVSRGAKFSSFADVCVTNGIKSAVLRFNRNAGKVLPDNFDEKAEDNLSPENIWLEKEIVFSFYNEMESMLSKKEWSVFRLYLEGVSYKEISEKLEVPLKVVDNAVFRVRKKLKMLVSHDKFIN